MLGLESVRNWLADLDTDCNYYLNLYNIKTSVDGCSGCKGMEYANGRGGGGGVQLEDEEAQAAGSLVNGPGPGA